MPDHFSSIEQLQQRVRELEAANRGLTDRVDALVSKARDRDRIRTRFETQLALYRRLHNANKQFNSVDTIRDACRIVLEIALRDLDFQKSLILLLTETKDLLYVEVAAGYFKQPDAERIKNLLLPVRSPVLSVAYYFATEIICHQACNRDDLIHLGNRLGMDEYIIFPLMGGTRLPVGLFVAGGQAAHMNLTARITPENELLLGISNLVRQAALTIERINFDSETEKNRQHLIQHTLDLASSNNLLRMEIAQRKRTQTELHAAKRAAEAANDAKSLFLANMSHEIRTPMNAVLGFAELLSENITDPKLRRYVDSIMSGSKSLLSLINDILDLSKIEAGKMELHFEPVNIRKLIEELYRIFSFRASQKKIMLTTFVDENIPEALLLDETRLRQILLNLIGNAVKYTKEGSVRLSVEAIAGDDRRKDLLISVEDTGIGISQDEQKAIFEAFKQQSGQKVGDYGGTGLGLAISKRLVAMMGGRIELSSDVGRGSRFDIHFSQVKVSRCEAPATHPPVHYDQVYFQNALILVVDNVTSNRQLIAEFLAASGLRIHEAEDGQGALHQVRQCRPDLILMDLKMPKMNGYDALAALRADDTTRQIPVVAVTANALRENLVHIKQTGFDDYLIKPVAKSRLLKVLCRLLPFVGVSENAVRKTSPHKDVFRPEGPSTLTTGRFKALVEELDGRLVPHWQRIRQRQHIPAIEQFARQVRQFGSEHKIAYLTDFGEQLLKYVDYFDVDSIHAEMDAFPLTVDHTKAILKQACIDGETAPY